MYSLVMLAALTPGGGDGTPVPVGYGCGMVAGCVGNGGCGGYAVVAGCSGCLGCTGSCHGGHFHGRGGLFGHHRKSCLGCAGYNCNGWNCFGSCLGSCAGWSCGGAGGGCAAWGTGGAHWNGWGAATSAGAGVGTGFAYVGTAYQSGVLQGSPFSCHGGCYGGYYGGGTTWGPPVGLPATSLSPYTTSYGHGPTILYRPYTEVNPPPAVIVPATDPKMTDPKDPKAVPPPVTDPKDPKGTDPKDMKDPKGVGASLKFRLPTAAQLYVDGRLTGLTGSERVFTTPALAPGQKFFYDVKAVLATDGAPVVEERRVIVEAGANLTESFDTLLAAEAKITGVAGK